MAYRIAGIDVHKRMLAVVVADVAVEGEYQFERRMVGTSPDQLRALADWLVEREVEEVVMESTAQYWRPVWEALERHWQPTRRDARGRRPDVGDAASGAGAVESGPARAEEGFPRRRTVGEAVGGAGTHPELCARGRAAPVADGDAPQVPAHVQSGPAAEPAWSACWRKRTSSCRVWCRICSAPVRAACCRRSPMAKRDPAAVAALASQRLRATPEQLCDALGACTDLHPVYRRLLAMALDELRLIEEQIQQLDRGTGAVCSAPHQDAVQRLAAVPGLGVDSAQQIIAEVGPTAATFPSAKRLASWVGACPGHDESAGVNHSRRSPHGNRQMRRLLNQAANAAVKTKGSIFELVYRRLVVRLGHAQTIGAIAHRLCRLVWKILHEGVVYEERGPAVTKQRAQRRAAKMIRELRSLGYRVDLIPAPSGSPA